MVFISVLILTFNIDPSTGLMSAGVSTDNYASRLARYTLSKALVPVNPGACSCDVPVIDELSDRFHFFVLEDASH